MPDSSELTKDKVRNAIGAFISNKNRRKQFVHNYQICRITEKEALFCLKKSKRELDNILRTFGVIRKRHSLKKLLQIEVL